MKRYGMVFLAALLVLSCPVTAFAVEAGTIGQDGFDRDGPSMVIEAAAEADTSQEGTYTPPGPPNRQAGRGEIEDIYQYWEENGYPSDVSYAFEAGGEVVGGDIYTWWMIGLVDADEARKQEILEMLAPTCLVEFDACLFPHSQKQAAYEALAPLAEEDENVLAVIFVRNSESVLVAVQDGFGKEYAQRLVGIYGAVVSIQEGMAAADSYTAGEPTFAMPGMGLDGAGAFPAGEGGRQALAFGGSYTPWIAVLTAALLTGGMLLVLRARAVPVAQGGNVAAPRAFASRKGVAEAVKNSAVEPDGRLLEAIRQRIGEEQP